MDNTKLDGIQVFLYGTLVHIFQSEPFYKYKEDIQYIAEKFKASKFAFL